MTSSAVTSFEFEPASRVASLSAYARAVSEPWIDLFLDANEGPARPSVRFEEFTRDGPDVLRRYPSTTSLEHLIAGQLGVDPSRIVVTNGGDDAIDRVCRVSLEPGRSILMHTPTFEMIARSARLAGADVTELSWEGDAFPAAEFVSRISPGTRLVSIVSPNNPTGEVVSLEDIRTVAAAARRVGALVLVDLAYVEFADADPTQQLMTLDNVVMVRTFSKAYGLAGLRIGYAVANRRVAGYLRVAGGPYPVSSLSLSFARKALADGDSVVKVARSVREQRAVLTAQLRRSGCTVLDSQANFVLVRTPKSDFLWRGLRALGIAVRRFEGRPGLTDALRITLPGEAGAFTRMTSAIETLFSPEAILLDLDGVLADVSGSYRAAIATTAESFGVSITARDIDRVVEAGNANNDWILTHRLLQSSGIAASLDQVTARFQGVYLGDLHRSGLRESETLIPRADVLRSLHGRYKLGVVTGRPRAEAEWFIRRFGIGDLFDAVICMEDAPAKPSPEPVRLAMERLGIRAAWMVGDTPDDVVAARRAGALPFGVVAPGQVMGPGPLIESGATRVLASLEELLELVP